MTHRWISIDESQEARMV